MRLGLSASEAGPRKPCACHGLPMRWNKRDDVAAGGYWRCVVSDREAARRRRARNPEVTRQRLKDWQAANVAHRRAYQRRWRYGITPEQYDALMTEQGGACALCDLPVAECPKGALHIDHDHATGRIRGLLCLRCNSALERLERDGWLARATDYLVHR